MKKLIYFLVITVFIVGCSSKVKPAKVVTEEPTEVLIEEYKGKEFSIVLDDMKIGEEPSLMVYQHKYKVLTLEKDSLHVTKTPWQTVNKKYFKSHENDLGMEVVSNHNGKLSRVAQPVGFGWAIGNEKHGEWEVVEEDTTKTANTNTNNGSQRRWRTNSSSIFFWYWLGSRRSTYRNDYRGYQSYNARGASYYGSKNTNGNYAYGTRSSHQQTKRSSFFSRRKQNSSKWNSITSKSSRNSSRYSKGSSTRSRSGGTGK